MTDTKAISAELRLKRFLYLNSEHPRFVTGNPDVHQKFDIKKITFHENLSSEDLRRIPVMFESLSKDDIPYKTAVFVALVALIRPPSKKIPQDVHELYTTVLNLFDNNQDLFDFVKYFRMNVKNVPSGLKKIIASYYFRQEPMELLQSVTEQTSYHGWSHKDMFKLLHYKTDSILNELILKFVMYGFNHALDSSTNTKEEEEILEYLKKWRAFKQTEDEKEAVNLMPTLNIHRVDQLPNKLIKIPGVWEGLIPRLSLSELISTLPKLYKLGFLKPGSLHDKVVEILLDKNVVDESKIQPIEVFIGIKNLEKGGKPKDPNLIKYLELKEDVETKQKLDPDYKKPNFAHQEPAKCPQILSALQKTLQASFFNLRPTSKRIMITVEVQEKMTESCLTTKNVTRLEAAAFVTLCLIKTNRNNVLSVFNGNSITLVQIDKNASIGQIIKKLKESAHDQVHWNTPFDWAKKNKKQFDIFLNIATSTNVLTSQEQKNRAKTAFENYCKEMNANETKLITYAPGIHNLNFADGTQPYLDVCGFDRNVLRVMEAFSKNLF